MGTPLQVLAREAERSADRLVVGSAVERAKLKSSVAEAFKDLARLERRTKTATPSKIRSLTRGFAYNHHFAIAAALLTESRNRRNRSNRGKKQRTYAQIIGDAAACTLFDHRRFRPRTIELPKDDGASRTVYQWGRAARVRSYAMYLILNAVVPENPFEVRSNQEALDRMTALANQGFRYFVWFDIKNFFDSVGPQHVTLMLRVHAKLMQTCFYEGGTERFAQKNLSGDTSSRKAPTGSDQLHLPQGAPTSSIISSEFLRSLIADVFGHDGAIITKCDDIVIGGTTMEEAEHGAKTLIERLLLHSAGPIAVHKVGRGSLDIRSKERFDQAEPAFNDIAEVSFDGVEIRPYVLAAGLLFRRDPDVAGSIKAQPPPRSWSRFQNRLKMRIRDAAARLGPNADHDSVDIKCEAAGRIYIDRFVKAFSVWTQTPESEERLEQSLTVALDQCAYPKAASDGDDRPLDNSSPNSPYLRIGWFIASQQITYTSRVLP